MHSNITDDDAYAAVQNWFSTCASQFACQNTEGPNATCKNKAVVENEFKNRQPIQSLDPSSGRITGKGLLKYFGQPGSAIGLLYMEYYVELQVNDHQVTATVSKMKYHHYNQRSYAEKPIYLWQGGKPFDSADKLANLVNSPTDCKDIQDVGVFTNKSISGLFTNLQSFLQSQKLIGAAQTTSATANHD